MVGKKMNRKDLIQKVAEQTNFTQKQVREILDAILDTIMKEVALSHKITLVGFGTFEQRKRKSRQGTNPNTGKKMMIPETNYVHFKAGKYFDENVNC